MGIINDMDKIEAEIIVGSWEVDLKKKKKSCQRRWRKVKGCNCVFRSRLIGLAIECMQKSGKGRHQKPIPSMLFACAAGRIVVPFVKTRNTTGSNTQFGTKNVEFPIQVIVTSHGLGYNSRVFLLLERICCLGVCAFLVMKVQ